jgi:hypothetical protein
MQGILPCLLLLHCPSGDEGTEELRNFELERGGLFVLHWALVVCLCWIVECSRSFYCCPSVIKLLWFDVSELN